MTEQIFIFKQEGRGKAVISESLLEAVKSLRLSKVSGLWSFIASFPKSELEAKSKARDDPRQQFLSNLKLMTEEMASEKDKKVLLSIIRKLIKKYANSKSQAEFVLGPRNDSRKSRTVKDSDTKANEARTKKRG